MRHLPTSCAADAPLSDLPGGRGMDRLRGVMLSDARCILPQLDHRTPS